MSSSSGRANEDDSRTHNDNVVAAIKDCNIKTTLVGSGYQSFRNHERLATTCSACFYNMPNGSCSNLGSSTKQVEWIEQQPETVMLFTIWLYTNMTKHGNREWSTGETLPCMFRLWILAERTEAIRLDNEVSDAIHAYCLGIEGTRTPKEVDLA